MANKGKLNQIDPHVTRALECRILKKSARKQMRQLGKKLLEDAPRRYVYTGYSS